jgi:hypothetical protein
MVMKDNLPGFTRFGKCLLEQPILFRSREYVDVCVYKYKEGIPLFLGIKPFRFRQIKVLIEKGSIPFMIAQYRIEGVVTEQIV